MPTPINKIKYNVGDKIGECVYLGDAYSKDWIRFANFKCVCGKEFIASIGKVKMLHTKTCGCLRVSTVVSMNTTHGRSRTPEFNSWVDLINRCTNEKYERYNDWGGRGIKVCERWLHSFENFLEDMGEKPTPQHSLDRYPNNGDGSIYEKSNCRWATPTEQALNRRSNFIVEYKGQREPLKKLTDQYGVSYTRVSQRIRILGWTVEDAFEKSKCYTNA